jgi:hypothetical protein
MLARSLDLTTLSDLARTCRQVRANLLQYRKMLVSQTLRCENDTSAPGGGGGGGDNRFWKRTAPEDPQSVTIPRLTSGRVGACARDMVGECRRCAAITCRV